MSTRSFGAPIRRNEDARLLRGQALFVDDVELPGMLYAAFLRSNVAHARIRSIDVSAARPAKVVAVYTAADLGSYWAPGHCRCRRRPSRTRSSTSAQVPLAGQGRHVGEPLVVLADSRYLAEDALGDIAVDIEPLPAVVDLEEH
jgi:CO/xanthine dehydrogenase Mo-binding subunit